MLHGFGGEHCAVGPLRNDFAGRRRRGSSQRAGWTMTQVRFSKRSRRLGQEAGLDGGSAHHGRVARDRGPGVVLFTGGPRVLVLQRLGDGGRGAGFIQVFVVPLRQERRPRQAGWSRGSHRWGLPLGQEVSQLRLFHRGQFSWYFRQGFGVRLYGGFQQSIAQAFQVTVKTVRAALGGRPRGEAPLGRVVVKSQLLQTVHQAVQPLPLLVDDLPVVGQGVKQRLSLGHKQALLFSFLFQMLIPLQV